MRLGPTQIETIKSEAHRQFGASARVILFGSRTDDQAGAWRASSARLACTRPSSESGSERSGYTWQPDP